jgi:nuclear pore complex protein Nup160
MHPSYFPQQLVHAHLPAPPLIPNAIPELRIPTQRHYPATSDVLGEPLHPDHAVSVVHDPITGILARSIQNGYGLELRSLSLVIHPYREKGQTGSETIRIFFPDRLRPLAEGCIVSSRRGGRVYILAVSQANVLYRLSFPLGSFKARAGDRFVFMTKGNDDWSEEWAVPDDVIVACGGVGAWTVVHEGSVALGGGDGGIVRLLRLSQGSGASTQSIAKQLLS